MNNLYLNYDQQKSIEEVIKFLYKSDKPDLVQPILDLMRMSENWFGRLEELRSVHALLQEGEEQ